MSAPGPGSLNSAGAAARPPTPRAGRGDNALITLIPRTGIAALFALHLNSRPGGNKDFRGRASLLPRYNVMRG